MTVVEPKILYPNVLLYKKAFLPAKDFSLYLDSNPKQEFEP